MIKRGMKVLVLNGPPGCGKDTIAQILADSDYDVEVLQFKDSMFDIAIAASGLGEEAFTERYNDRDLKEVPWDLLGGLTQREFMIRISEEWVKPTFGDAHFGKLAAEACKQSGSKFIVFSDGGFPDEIEALQDELGKENIVIVRLYREGYDFSNDSRKYISDTGSQEYNVMLLEDRPYFAANCIKILLY